ncbi:MAG: class I SAM-dependent methyltransferase [Myxococcales bacterium]|nr:class I SAM-dependent methyltransferase [Myxococcales bacterium]
MDSRERFTATVGDYERARPDYPDALIAALVARAPWRRAVDLGSGTGILSRQLAAAGLDVIGVEPNAAMRLAAERAGGGPRYHAGQAESTGLAVASADLVVGAQAFHWFDLPATVAEIDRVAIARAPAAAIWNVRAEEAGGFAAAYEALLGRFVGRRGPGELANVTIDALARLRPGGERLVFPHAQHLDRDGAHARAWSSSYVAHGVRDHAAFDRALDEVFGAHALDGAVTLRYRTLAYVWSTSP